MKVSLDNLVARSASDKTDDWPYWMVWNGHLNVTAQVGRILFGGPTNGGGFVDRETAEHMVAAMDRLAKEEITDPLREHRG
ncbi:MAG: hypothetical protein OXR62_10985 [Ahrensia sp.]|nr:hypothetical protein [Ahrensia sp.]